MDIKILLLTFVLFGPAICYAKKSRYGIWSYKSNSQHGPRHWGRIKGGAKCLGANQSPIDINTVETTEHEYQPFVKTGYHSNGVSGFARPLRMTNNGKTVAVTLEGDYLIKGGGLPSTYRAAQMHFHWGADWTKGSEHTLNGQSFPAELHVVHYDARKYRTLGEAVKQPDGLAVLGFFMKIGRHNQAWDNIINQLSSIRYVNSNFDFTQQPFRLASLLPRDFERFYRYKGSLTTPGCYESVIWTVFATPIELSAVQLAKFRTITRLPAPPGPAAVRSRFGNEGAERSEDLIVDNFRPVQRLNFRNVYQSFEHEEPEYDSEIESSERWDMYGGGFDPVFTLGAGGTGGAGTGTGTGTGTGGGYRSDEYNGGISNYYGGAGNAGNTGVGAMGSTGQFDVYGQYGTTQNHNNPSTQGQGGAGGNGGVGQGGGQGQGGVVDPWDGYFGAYGDGGDGEGAGLDYYNGHDGVGFAYAGGDVGNDGNDGTGGAFNDPYAGAGAGASTGGAYDPYQDPYGEQPGSNNGGAGTGAGASTGGAYDPYQDPYGEQPGSNNGGAGTGAGASTGGAYDPYQDPYGSQPGGNNGAAGAGAGGAYDPYADPTNQYPYGDQYGGDYGTAGGAAGGTAGGAAGGTAGGAAGGAGGTYNDPYGDPTNQDPYGNQPDVTRDYGAVDGTGAGAGAGHETDPYSAGNNHLAGIAQMWQQFLNGEHTNPEDAAYYDYGPADFAIDINDQNYGQFV